MFFKTHWTTYRDDRGLRLSIWKQRFGRCYNIVDVGI